MSLRPKQLTELLTRIVPAREPVCITGAPGIGKTEIVKQACEKMHPNKPVTKKVGKCCLCQRGIIHGMHLIITHPVVDEPIDYKGLPFAVDGEAEFLPYGNLKLMLEAKEPTVVFLDDFGQAMDGVQKASMQLLLERSINGQPISEYITFLVATNRKKDRAGVGGILEPVKSRFTTIVELETQLDDWIEWALENAMPNELISFINYMPDLLDKFEATADITNSPCPRTIANVGRLIKLNLPRGLEHEAYAGAAGAGFSASLTGFLRIWRDLPDPDYCLANPSKVDIPTEPAVLYALSGSVAAKTTKKLMPNLIQLSERMPEEYGVRTVWWASIQNKDLQNTTAFHTWVKNHADVVLV